MKNIKLKSYQLLCVAFISILVGFSSFSVSAANGDDDQTVSCGNGPIFW